MSLALGSLASLVKCKLNVRVRGYYSLLHFSRFSVGGSPSQWIRDPLSRLDAEVPHDGWIPSLISSMLGVGSMAQRLVDLDPWS
jgi:hypothetical protein